MISETATPGFLARITDNHLQRAIDHLDPPTEHRITGIGVAGASITTQVTPAPAYPVTLRSQLERTTSFIRSHGVLITLDEINSSSIGELAEFATEHQHAIRNDLDVAFVGAGLRGAIKDVLSHKSLTFLRRSLRPPIDFLEYDDVIDAPRIPIVDRGREIDTEALDYAVRATQGYPFLAQLIGDLAWKASPRQTTISLSDVKSAYRKARRTMGRNIHEPSLSDLSPTDLTVLARMVASDGPTAVSDLRTSLGVTSKYLREYLRDHVVADATTDRALQRPSFPAPPSLEDE